MKRTLILIAGVVFASALGLAWVASRSIRESEVARAEIAKKRLRVETELQAAKARLTAAKQTEADLRSALAEFERANAPKAAKAQDVSPKPMAEDLAQFVKWVEARHARRLEENKETATYSRFYAYTRLAAAMMNATFFKAQGLSPAQVEKFLDLQIKREADKRDLQALIDEGLVAQGDPVIAQFKQQKLAEYEVSMRDLLGGDAAMKELTEYERTAWQARYILGGIAGTAAVAGAPFTNTQLEQLVTIVANASPNYQRGKWVDDGDIDWNVVDAQARAVLTDAQFTVFTKYNGPDFMGSRGRSVRNVAWAKAEAKDKAAQNPATPPGK